jgi:hypothetical protein
MMAIPSAMKICVDRFCHTSVGAAVVGTLFACTRCAGCGLAGCPDPVLLFALFAMQYKYTITSLQDSNYTCSKIRRAARGQLFNKNITITGPRIECHKWYSTYSGTDQ